MKKLLFIMTALLILFAACKQADNDGDDSESTVLDGTWVYNRANLAFSNSIAKLSCPGCTTIEMGFNVSEDKVTFSEKTPTECNGTSAEYQYTIGNESRKTLTLRANNEPCGARKTVLERTWSQSSSTNLTNSRNASAISRDNEDGFWGNFDL